MVEKEVKEIKFDPNSERLKQVYIHVFERVKSDVMYTTKYDENGDIRTTYLGTSKMKRQLIAEHNLL